MASESGYTLKIVLDAEDKASHKISGLKAVLQEAERGVSHIGNTLVTALAGAAAGGFAALTTGLVTSVSAAMESQDAQAQLAAVLESTGGIAGVTADMVNELASEIQRLTRFEDDTAVAAQTALLRFTSIGKDVFPRVTWAAADMAQALGIDLVSAAETLGKALNSPAQGMMLLRRAGIQFTEEQEKTVEALVATGRITEAQKFILDELSVRFGGSATTAAKTFAGQLERLKNMFGDIQEAIGTALLPVLQQFAERAIEYLARPEVQNAIENMAQALTGFAFEAAEVIPQVIAWIQSLASFLQENEGIVVAVLAAMGAAIATFVYTTVIPAAVATITSLAPAIGTLALVGGAAYLLYQAWTTNFGGIRDKVNEFIEWVQPVLSSIAAWLSTAIPQALATLQNVWSAVWTAIQQVVSAVLPVIYAVYQAYRAAFEGDWYAFGARLRTAWDTLWNLVTRTLQSAWAAIRAIIAELVNKIVNFFATTDWGSIGRSIVEGIARGITAGVSAITRAATAAARAALDAAKGFLGIRSPSRVFEQQVAVNMMLGWIAGIRRLTPQLEAAVITAGARTVQSVTTVNNYNLSVQSVRSSEQIERDFWLLRGGV